MSAGFSSVLPVLQAAGQIIGAVGGMFAGGGGGGGGKAYQQAIEAQTRAMEQATQAQSKALEIQNRQSQVQQRQDRLRAVRQTRVQRGQIVSQAGVANTLNSSSVFGGISSLQSQLASNIGTSNQLQGLETDRVAQLNKAGVFQTEAYRQGNYASAAQAKFSAQQANNAASANMWTGVGNVISSVGKIGNIFNTV